MDTQSPADFAAKTCVTFKNELNGMFNWELHYFCCWTLHMLKLVLKNFLVSSLKQNQKEPKYKPTNKQTETRGKKKKKTEKSDYEGSRKQDMSFAF